jgi:hypothetical protein
MRKLIISAVAAFTLITTLGVSSAVVVSDPSQVAASAISELHKPVRIGVTSQVLRRMP